MKKKTNLETIFETIKDVIKDTNVYWCDQPNGENHAVYWAIHNLFINYDGKYDLDNLIYNYFGKLDTCLRPLMYSVVKFIATINGYGSGCFNKDMNAFHVLFMTGIKKSQIKRVCKALSEGYTMKSDCKDMEKILTKYFCEMTIEERIDDLKEELKYCIACK